MNLLALLANTKVAPVDDEKINWPHDSKGKFTTKSFHRQVCEGSRKSIFLPTQSYGLRLLLKLVFLAWGAKKGKVPTEDMLKRRNFNLVNRCPM